MGMQGKSLAVMLGTLHTLRCAPYAMLGGISVGNSHMGGGEKRFRVLNLVYSTLLYVNKTAFIPDFCELNRITAYKFAK